MSDVSPILGGDGENWEGTGEHSCLVTAINNGCLRLKADGEGGGVDSITVDNISVEDILKPTIETLNTNFVSAVADAVGPEAVTGLQASWSQK